MKTAVIVFPGSNCDRDIAVALEAVTGRAPAMVWHRDTELPDGVGFIALPGGFSYGDYLRSGAMAARSPIMRAVIEAAAKGEAFVIAKAGRPMVKVVPIDPPEERAKPKRYGFLKGQVQVPDDFDTFMQAEIIAMFEDGPLFPPQEDDEKRPDER